jgi:hypothetical protein
LRPPSDRRFRLQELALERLRETLVAHAREGGVWFDSRAWIVKARRP